MAIQCTCNMDPFLTLVCEIQVCDTGVYNLWDSAT